METVSPESEALAAVELRLVSLDQRIDLDGF